ncbi:collagen-like protein [Bradyrhizobium elkanii]|uniref:Tail fiber protein n=1 Tax=Bradyrhizobium elkanii TaxID=29448 RepID=A0ABV4F057_BRAEL|nr:collagen-like protein [Bradyrhizobium elkanii]MCP1757830.1 hypothetical protein [Bradyrhizobium elkanii]MCS3881873.1 hypothetical protein [Bradyrhizobium elkanii]MCS4218632.1 hypothetical protein [Bradyrhizobium elkanii]MCW2110068.1 hypothetical protein [Bradyrhizobium elkanii]MCW2201560.1 hypothetical protein [Bradyrhizobium elkanii]
MGTLRYQVLSPSGISIGTDFYALNSIVTLTEEGAKYLLLNRQICLATGQQAPAGQPPAPNEDDVYLDVRYNGVIETISLTKLRSMFPSIKGDAGPLGPKGPAGPQGEKGLKGDTGRGIALKGIVATNLDLPSSAEEGDVWLAEETGRGYAWSDGNWKDIGAFRGPQGGQGPAGPAGPRGLKGDQGVPGPKGEAGLKGDPGDPGNPTYAYRAEAGMTAAEASATSAAASNASAANHEANARSYKQGAETAATNAAASETSANQHMVDAAASRDAAAGSALSAGTSAGVATTAAGSAQGYATSAQTSAETAVSAQNAAADAVTKINEFKGIYYGGLTADPASDPLGAAPNGGDFYFNTTTKKFRAYDSTAWNDMVSVGTLKRFIFSAGAGQTTFTGADAFTRTLAYTPGAVEVVVNGMWLPYSDYTANNGTSIVLNTPCAGTDVVYVFAMSAYSAADTLQKSANGSDILDKAAFRSNLGLGTAVGQIGQRLVAQGSTGNLVTGVPQTCTSILLPVGTWDIEAHAVFGGSGSTATSDWISMLAARGATVSAGDTVGVSMHTRMPSGYDYSINHTHPKSRITSDGTYTIYLNAQATVNTGTVFNCTGTLQAIKVAA